jgi:glycosyltransferase involved in cell wall biosynthesis
MNESLISVALCTYNGEKYIREQLDSIISQTYKKLEIVIVDDASRDNTFAIVKAYAERDARIKCFRNDTNLGFNKNFEKALALTSGEFVAVSDQDDIWLPGKLQTLLNNIGDNWLVFSNSAYIGDSLSGKLLKNFRLPVNYERFLLRNYVTGHTVLMRRIFLDFALPFPQQGFYDWWMGFVAAYHHKLTFYDDVLTYYRVHNESVIQKRQELGKAEMVEYDTIKSMLNAFEEYKNLKPGDKIFIGQLRDAYKLKATVSRSIPLIKIVNKYYHELFPNRKPWKSMTKLIFAFKYAKGIDTKTGN